MSDDPAVGVLSFCAAALIVGVAAAAGAVAVAGAGYGLFVIGRAGYRAITSVSDRLRVERQTRAALDELARIRDDALGELESANAELVVERDAADALLDQTLADMRAMQQEYS